MPEDGSRAPRALATWPKPEELDQWASCRVMDLATLAVDGEARVARLGGRGRINTRQGRPRNFWVPVPVQATRWPWQWRYRTEPCAPSPLICSGGGFAPCVPLRFTSGVFGRGPGQEAAPAASGSFFFFFFFSADRALFTAASCLPCSRCVLQVQTIAGGAPSSLVLSSATDGRVALWDWRDGDNAVPVLSLALHQSGINGLAARVVDSAPGREGGGRGRGEQDSKCRWM